MTDQLPHRRLRLRADIEADDLAELHRTLREIIVRLSDENAPRHFAGGLSHSYHFELTFNSQMDGDHYHQALALWVEKQKWTEKQKVEEQ